MTPIEDDDEYTDEEKERIKQIQNRQREARAIFDRTAARQAAIKAAMIAEAKEIISAGRKARATKLHPDIGGSSDGMQTLNSAATWLLTFIEKVQH